MFQLPANAGEERRLSRLQSVIMTVTGNRPLNEPHLADMGGSIPSAKAGAALIKNSEFTSVIASVISSAIVSKRLASLFLLIKHPPYKIN